MSIKVIKVFETKKVVSPKQGTKMLQPILIAVQKIPGNPMSNEENTRYSKQTQRVNNFILKAYNFNNDHIFMSVKV